MSTKIFNGYLLHPISFSDLHSFCRGLQLSFGEAAAGVTRRMIAHHAVQYIDTQACGSLPSEENPAGKKPINVAVDQLTKRVDELRSTRSRDPVIDTEVSAVFIPHFIGILCLFFAENNEMIAVWEKTEEQAEKGLTSYGYWNHTDRPDEISEEEWDMRAKAWNEALGWDTPRDRGFTFEFSGAMSPYRERKFEDLKPFIPDFETRLLRAAKAKVSQTMVMPALIAEKGEDWRASDFMRAMSWLDTADAVPAIEQAKASLLPLLEPYRVITEEILTSPFPVFTT